MEFKTILLNLVLRQPYFGYILSSLDCRENPEVQSLELRPGNPGKLFYNTHWLDQQTEEHCYGAVLHELLHLLLLHSIRRKGRSIPLWAMACDLAVNQQISEKLLPPDYLRLKTFCEKYRLNLEEKGSAEYYYQALKDAGDFTPPTWQAGQKVLQISFPDQEDSVIRVPQEESLSEIEERALRSSLEQISRRAAEEGEIHQGLALELQSIYGELGVNWRNVLRKFLANRGRMRQKKSPKRVSRRYTDLPGTLRTKSLKCLVALDESGSISNQDLDCFYQELLRIKRMTKARIEVTRFDTDCTPPVPLERYIKVKNRQKQGGTDFRPIFKLADSRGDGYLLIFTDGDGAYPKESNQKVLWVLTKETRKEPPFGERVQFRS